MCSAVKRLILPELFTCILVFISDVAKSVPLSLLYNKCWSMSDISGDHFIK